MIQINRPCRKKEHPGGCFFMYANIRSIYEEVVAHMKANTLPAVHCIYTEAEKSLTELLGASFRLYLIRTLADLGPSAVPYSR
jgi:hypothetical protein